MTEIEEAKKLLAGNTCINCINNLGIQISIRQKQGICLKSHTLYDDDKCPDFEEIVTIDQVNKARNEMEKYSNYEQS